MSILVCLVSAFVRPVRNDCLQFQPTLLLGASDAMSIVAAS